MPQYETCGEREFRAIPIVHQWVYSSCRVRCSRLEIMTGAQRCMWQRVRGIYTWYSTCWTRAPPFTCVTGQFTLVSVIHCRHHAAVAVCVCVCVCNGSQKKRAYAEVVSLCWTKRCYDHIVEFFRRYGHSPLDDAVRFCHHDIIKLLVKGGAHLNMPSAKLGMMLCK